VPIDLKSGRLNLLEPSGAVQDFFYFLPLATCNNDTWEKYVGLMHDERPANISVLLYANGYNALVDVPALFSPQPIPWPMAALEANFDFEVYLSRKINVGWFKL
jgi:hypothetical protein